MTKQTKCILVDLDGTLANCEHRQHYVQGPGKKNWKSFFAHMYDDEVNEPLNEVLKVLHQYYDIYFVTARPNDYYGVTVRWLLEKGGWMKNEYSILMRKSGDFRQDSIVKQEILNDIKDGGSQILMVFDDREQVVKMWRDNGLFCCQVADHSF
jgi:5'(3')-deoxyribonucleotidase